MNIFSFVMLLVINFVWFILSMAIPYYFGKIGFWFVVTISVVVTIWGLYMQVGHWVRCALRNTRAKRASCKG